MNDRIRVALVSAGALGRKHLAVLAEVPGFEVAGIADPSPAARALAEEQASPGTPMYPQQPAGNGVIAGTQGSLSLPQLDLWPTSSSPARSAAGPRSMQRERVP